MSALAVLDQSEANGARRVKVKDSDLILQVSLGGQVRVESGGSPPPSDQEVWGVHALKHNPTTHRSSVEVIAWKHTQSAASELAADLTAMGATCYPDLISPEPPTSAQ